MLSMMDILPGAVPLMVDVRQTGSGPLAVSTGPTPNSWTRVVLTRHSLSGMASERRLGMGEQVRVGRLDHWVERRGPGRTC